MFFFVEFVASIVATKIETLLLKVFDNITHLAVIVSNVADFLELCETQSDPYNDTMSFKGRTYNFYNFVDCSV